MIDGDPIVPMTPDSDRCGPFEDDSETIPPTPRRALVVALTKAVHDASAVGDHALARFAAEVLSAYSVWRLVRRKARGGRAAVCTGECDSRGTCWSYRRLPS